MRQYLAVRSMHVSAALLLLLSFSTDGCVPHATRRAPSVSAAVLYPQSSRSTGPAWLQPRHAREPRPLPAPGLLEPGDWIETGAGAKAELLLPCAALRMYEVTRLQVLFQFEERTALARELRLERGEVLVSRPETPASEPFEVRTLGLHVSVAPGSTVLIASHDGVHRAVCYEGSAEARNVRVRGQTVIRMGEGQVLTLDDAQTLAFLEERNVADEWRRWEREEVFSAGGLAARSSSAAPTVTGSAEPGLPAPEPGPASVQ